MSRLIIHCEGRYALWSTMADAPCTIPLTYDEVLAELRASRLGSEAPESRLGRAARTGTSALSSSFEEVVEGNRAGPGESEVPVALVREWMVSPNYGGSPMELCEWLADGAAANSGAMAKAQARKPSEGSEGSSRAAGGSSARWGRQRLERRRIRTVERLKELTKDSGRVWLVSGADFYESVVEKCSPETGVVQFQLRKGGRDGESWFNAALSLEALGLKGGPPSAPMWPLREQAEEFVRG